MDLFNITATLPSHHGLVYNTNVEIIFQVLHTMLMVVSLGTNCVSLVVIYGVVSRLTPPLQLLTSLAFSHMLAPWAIITMYFPASPCQEEIHAALLLTAHNSCALVLLVLAVIHKISTFHPLHYDKIISQRRIWITINIIWIISILTAHMHFLATLAHHDPSYTFCVNVQNNFKMAVIMAASFCGALGLVTLCLYGKMLLHLKPIEAALAPSEDSGAAVQPRKSTHGVVTGVLLASLHLACWTPYLVVKWEHAAMYADPPISVLLGNQVCQVLVLVSCFTAPVVYGLRMTNIQTGYHQLYQRSRGWMATMYHKVRGHDPDKEAEPSTPLNPIESIC